MAELAVEADLDAHTVARLLENRARSHAFRFGQHGNDLDSVVANRSLTGRHQCHSYAASLIFGQDGQSVDPAFSIIVRPQHGTDDAVTIRSHQIEIGELLELPLKGLVTFAPFGTETQTTVRSDFDNLRIVFHLCPADRQQCFAISFRYVHESPAWRYSRRNCDRSNKVWATTAGMIERRQIVTTLNTSDRMVTAMSADAV